MTPSGWRCYAQSECDCAWMKSIKQENKRMPQPLTTLHPLVILRAFLPRRYLPSVSLIAAFPPTFSRKLRLMPPSCPPPAAYRASVLHFTQPPPTGIPANVLSSPPPHEYFEDGCLLIAGGKVVAAGGGADHMRACYGFSVSHTSQDLGIRLRWLI